MCFIPWVGTLSVCPQKMQQSSTGHNLPYGHNNIAYMKTQLKRLGFGYDWAAPRLYGPERVAGFPLGMLHGALMPVALPSLLLGKDVPIYAERNLGRSYKLGYIAGINVCGFIFFGLAFWQPARPSAKPQNS